MNLPKVSVHGKALLAELSHPPSLSLPSCLHLISSDPLAGLLKRPDTGDTAFHLLFAHSHRSEETVATLLDALLLHSPMGVRAVNREGRTPLHVLLSRAAIPYSMAEKVLAAFPRAASIEDSGGYLPLFLAVMHNDERKEDSLQLANLVRRLCQAHPAGPSALNKTK